MPVKHKLTHEDFDKRVWEAMQPPKTAIPPIDRNVLKAKLLGQGINNA